MTTSEALHAINELDRVLRLGVSQCGVGPEYVTTIKSLYLPNTQINMVVFISDPSKEGTHYPDEKCLSRRTASLL